MSINNIMEQIPQETAVKVVAGTSVSSWNFFLDFDPTTLNSWLAVVVGILTALVLVQTLWRNRNK